MNSKEVKHLCLIIDNTRKGLEIQKVFYKEVDRVDLILQMYWFVNDGLHRKQISLTILIYILNRL